MGKVNTKITQEATSGAQHGSLSTRPAIKRHLARSGYLREDVFLSDAQLLGGTQRGPLVVTGHHVHSNALAMQAGNSHLGLGPDEVAERQHPGQLLVDGAINTDGAFFLRPHHQLRGGERQRDLVLLHPTLVADQHPQTVHNPAHAQSRLDKEITAVGHLAQTTMYADIQP